MKNINRFNIRKWYKMLTGTSILHVEQGMGKIYEKGMIKGYYNDLTQKVLKDPNTDVTYVPETELATGEMVLFPTAIFQYGLGAYDLFLLKKDPVFIEKFRIMSDWALDHQLENGAWNNFFDIHPEAPYSAMSQGEGASLLIRAYVEFDENKYLEAARKAIDFMLLPIEEGGTTHYQASKRAVVLKEYTNEAAVLNGWIFGIFGLYDYLIVSHDDEIREMLERTLFTLKSQLDQFDNGYWSMYNTAGIITSPFYHRLHIAQLQVLFDLFGMQLFREYANRWRGYQENWFYRKRAFTIKVLQKLTQ